MLDKMKDTKLAAQPGKHTNLPQKPADHDVHHGATSDKAAEAVKPKGIGADENPNDKLKGNIKKAMKQEKMSAFERNKLDFQIKLSVAKLKGRGINLAEEGGTSYDWDTCIADQIKEYGDEETAKKVCGYIKSTYGS
jgi:hypothetical protein